MGGQSRTQRITVRPRFLAALGRTGQPGAGLRMRRSGLGARSMAMFMSRASPSLLAGSPRPPKDRLTAVAGRKPKSPEVENRSWPFRWLAHTPPGARGKGQKQTSTQALLKRGWGLDGSSAGLSHQRSGFNSRHSRKVLPQRKAQERSRVHVYER